MRADIRDALDSRVAPGPVGRVSPVRRTASHNGPTTTAPRRRVAGGLAVLGETLRVDRSLLAPVVGVITAVPVITVFAVGLAFANVTGAIAMAIGAQLIAIVSLIASPRLSIPLALVDAVAMGSAVLLGMSTVTVPWLHVGLLAIWCFGAGLVAIFGNVPAAIGNQSIIAYVVFGRFAGSIPIALHLAGFVVVGCVVEVTALIVLRLPPSLRVQRTKLAAACDAVAALARGAATGSAIAALAVVDDAERALAAPSLFGRTDVRDLRAVLDQVRRVRLELTTIAGLRVRLLERLPASTEELRATRQAVADVLEEIAVALRTQHSPTWSAATATLEDGLRRLDALDEPRTDIIVGQYVSHLAAIGGQLRSMRLLVNELITDESPRARTIATPSWQRAEAVDWRGGLTVLRDAMRPSSSALRHAVRLAVAVPASVLVASWLSLPRGYWLPFSVAVILKPDYSTLLRRGVGRLVGTAIGATVATLVVSVTHPDLAWTAVIVSAFAWAAYSTWSANFSISIGFITALVLTLLSTSLRDPMSTALDRLLDVALGGLIAVISYLAWPTPSRAGVAEAQRDLFGTLDDYLSLTMAVVSSQPVDPAALTESSRLARVAWARAEAAVGRSIEEPNATRIDPTQGRGLLAVALRILRATHALRIEAERGARVGPDEVMLALAREYRVALARLRAQLDNATPGPPSDLRRRYGDAKRLLDANGVAPTIASHLDELVNAINTGAHLTGLATLSELA